MSDRQPEKSTVRIPNGKPNVNKKVASMYNAGGRHDDVEKDDKDHGDTTESDPDMYKETIASKTEGFRISVHLGPK